MSYLKPQKLVRVKQLIDNVKFDEADQLIKEFEKKKGHTLYDITLCNLLKCDILYYQGLYDDVIKLTKQTYKKSLKLGKNLLSVDILLRMAAALFGSGQWDKAHDATKQGEQLMKTLTQELTTEYKQREAYLAHLKGWYYDHKGKLDQAIKQFEISISLRKELDDKMDIVWPLIGIARIYMNQKGDFDCASKYLEQGLLNAKESGNIRCIEACLNHLAYVHLLKGELNRSIMIYEQNLTILNKTKYENRIAKVNYFLGQCYAMKGELNQSIKCSEQSLEACKELNHKLMMADLFNNLSESYRLKGELNHALDCIEQSMVLNHELGNLRALANNHDFLIKILIDKGDLKRAQISLNNMEKLNENIKDKQIEWAYLLNKVRILRTSYRALNRGKAEEILKQILTEEDLSYESRLGALINLCELLLTDFQITNEKEILEEIKPLIEQLLFLSERSHSFWILGETYLLQAKLALINFDMKAARRLLTQAQKIAESYGIKRLAIQISHEHDELLKNLKMWENLKETEASLSERWKLAGMNTQMEEAVRKRMLESPKISEEDPVMILILTEGGNLLFSKKFLSDFTFEDDILGSFLTAVHFFTNEVFSEGLNRAVFGQYTLLMNSLQPFLICYIFKGYSYSAQSKIKSFIDSIQNDKIIWQSLQKFFKKSTSVQLNDIPTLESLITDIFIKKILQ